MKAPAARWLQPVRSLKRAVAGRLRAVRLHGRDALSWQALRLDLAFWRYARRERLALQAARRQYADAYIGQSQPLVSVIIGTYNRGPLLVNRTLPSVFNQSYQNFEIVIVGDHCTDDTEERLARLNESRLRFFNLPERGQYPQDPYQRWMVAGSTPINRALELAQGPWLAYLDDDDQFTPDHIEAMLDLALRGDFELIFGQYRPELEPGVWVSKGRAEFPNGRPPYRPGGIHHSSVMFRSYLRLFRYAEDAWRLNLPVDNHRWQRMGRAGVRAGYLPKVVSLQPLRPGETLRTWEAILRAAPQAQKRQARE